MGICEEAHDLERTCAITQGQQDSLDNQREKKKGTTVQGLGSSVQPNTFNNSPGNGKENDHFIVQGFRLNVQDLGLVMQERIPILVLIWWLVTIRVTFPTHWKIRPLI